jgi:hypothetical protein
MAKQHYQVRNSLLYWACPDLLTQCLPQVESQWKVSGSKGVQERWRDEYLWLLPGIAKIPEISCFYFHLLEECKALTNRVKRVKQRLNRMRYQAFELPEHLKYYSPLSPLLRSIRRTEKKAN